MVDAQNESAGLSSSTLDESAVTSYFSHHTSIKKVYAIGDDHLMALLARLGIETVVYGEGKISFDDYDSYELDEAVQAVVLGFS